jgi:hypothetical protein
LTEPASVGYATGPGITPELAGTGVDEVGTGTIADDRPGRTVELVGNGIIAELGVELLIGELGESSPPQAPRKKAEPIKTGNRIFLQIIKASQKQPQKCRAGKRQSNIYKYSFLR